MSNLSLRQTLNRIIKLFDRREQIKLIFVSISQIFLSFLDLAGIAIIGVLAALAVTAVESKAPGNRVTSVLNILHLGSLNFRSQITVLGLFASLVLILRTILSIWLSRKTLHFLSRRGAIVSNKLISHLFTGPILTIQENSKQEIVFATTVGVQALTLGILGNMISLLTDLSLLIVISAGLFVVAPIVALSAVFLFSILGIVLYKLLKNKSLKIGRDEIRFGITSNQKLVEFMDTYRETVVKDRREFYIDQISNLRLNLADVQAERTFLPNISKYVVETAVVLGALIISSIQFALSDATHAVGALSIFLVAGTRIAPAIMRMQQYLIQIRTSVGSGTLALEMLSKITTPIIPASSSANPDFEYAHFEPSVSVMGLEFQYATSTEKTFENITFNVKTGEHVAIVGPSGSGKSTLVDLMLGIHRPGRGEIQISGLDPLEAFHKWPGAVGYVPQKVSIIMGTIRENISMGFESNYPEEFYWDALKKAQLDEFVRNMTSGLDSKVGDEGNTLSGGQRQRLGIARALFTKPKLLVLDEATSSLDVETEFQIAEVIKEISKNVTVITIAHRLSSIRECDYAIYLDKGNICGIGSFDELRVQIPDFENQLRLMNI